MICTRGEMVFLKIAVDREHSLPALCWHQESINSTFDFAVGCNKQTNKQNKSFPKLSKVLIKLVEMICTRGEMVFLKIAVDSEHSLPPLCWHQESINSTFDFAAGCNDKLVGVSAAPTAIPIILRAGVP